MLDFTLYKDDEEPKTPAAAVEVEPAEEDDDAPAPPAAARLSELIEAAKAGTTAERVELHPEAKAPVSKPLPPPAALKPPSEAAPKAKPVSKKVVFAAAAVLALLAVVSIIRQGGLIKGPDAGVRLISEGAPGDSSFNRSVDPEKLKEVLEGEGAAPAETAKLPEPEKGPQSAEPAEKPSDLKSFVTENPITKRFLGDEDEARGKVNGEQPAAEQAVEREAPREPTAVAVAAATASRAAAPAPAVKPRPVQISPKVPVYPEEEPFVSTLAEVTPLKALDGLPAGYSGSGLPAPAPSALTEAAQLPDAYRLLPVSSASALAATQMNGSRIIYTVVLATGNSRASLEAFVRNFPVDNVQPMIVQRGPDADPPFALVAGHYFDSRSAYNMAQRIQGHNFHPVVMIMVTAGADLN